MPCLASQACNCVDDGFINTCTYRGVYTQNSLNSYTVLFFVFKYMIRLPSIRAVPPPLHMCTSPPPPCLFLHRLQSPLGKDFQPRGTYRGHDTPYWSRRRLWASGRSGTNLPRASSLTSTIRRKLTNPSNKRHSRMYAWASPRRLASAEVCSAHTVQRWDPRKWQQSCLRRVLH